MDFGRGRASGAGRKHERRPMVWETFNQEWWTKGKKMAPDHRWVPPHCLPAHPATRMQPPHNPAHWVPPGPWMPQKWYSLMPSPPRPPNQTWMDAENHKGHPEHENDQKQQQEQCSWMWMQATHLASLLVEECGHMQSIKAGTQSWNQGQAWKWRQQGCPYHCQSTGMWKRHRRSAQFPWREMGSTPVSNLLPDNPYHIPHYLLFGQVDGTNEREWTIEHEWTTMNVNGCKWTWAAPHMSKTQHDGNKEEDSWCRWKWTVGVPIIEKVCTFTC